MRHDRAQRGGATLGVTLVLLLVMALAAGFAQRRHAGELRASTHHVQSTTAFEAAEAGLAWATAMLDTPASGFRERHLVIAPDTGAITPSTRRAACARVDDAWRCPREDDATPATDGTITAAFEIRFEPAATPGLVRLVSFGCSRGPCVDTGEARETSARLDVTLALVPALAHAPLAALTVRDDVDAGIAALGLHNSDAGSGIAVHAGGAVRASHARFTGPPGAPAPLVAAQDTGLHAIDPERLFASLFGLDKALWRQQPTVATIRCSGRCNDTLAGVLATHRMVFVDGDLELDGTLVAGSADQPVIVVAAGAVRLRGAVSIHGLVYGAGALWDDAAGGALLRGALVSESGYAGTGAPDLVHDHALLAALKTTGSFARLPGSWRDFR